MPLVVTFFSARAFCLHPTWPALPLVVAEMCFAAVDGGVVCSRELSGAVERSGGRHEDMLRGLASKRQLRHTLRTSGLIRYVHVKRAAPIAWLSAFASSGYQTLSSQYDYTTARTRAVTIPRRPAQSHSERELDSTQSMTLN